MCHHYEFSAPREHEQASDDEAVEEVTPEVDEADDVEILTDGGDE